MDSKYYKHFLKFLNLIVITYCSHLHHVALEDKET